MSESPQKLDRRSFVTTALRVAGAAGIGGLAVTLAMQRGQSGELVWQLDPYKCVSCGNCATFCVLDESAVKCVHSFPMCGYCDLCTGYFLPSPIELKTGAENQLCPTGAIQRQYIEDPYYEYTIIKELCIGCGKCVKGCNAFGNGSLYLQVQHDRCKNCNECAIAVSCPSQAFSRVPAKDAYRLKIRDNQA